MRNNLKTNNIKYLLITLLFVEISLIVFCNLTKIDNNLDCDNAKLMKHIIKMWEEKTPIIDNWSYKTTLEWDCTAFFAIPIYGITKNIYVSCGLSNIMLVLIFIFAVFYLFYRRDTLYPLIALSIILIPYSIGMLDYYNMMFFAGAQYLIKVSIPLIYAGIVLNVESGVYKEGIHKKLFVFFALVYAIWLLVSAVSSGIYVFITGVFPIILVYVIYKFVNWTRVPVTNIVMILYSVIASFVGTKFNEIIMGGTRSAGMTLTDVYGVHSNVVSSIIGIFELFGGITYESDVAVISVDGISIVGKVCVVLLLFICGILAVKHVKKSDFKLNIILLLAVFVWNCFILFLSYTRAGSETYEYRYHLMGMIPLICVAAIVIGDIVIHFKDIQKFFLTLIFVIGLLSLTIISYRPILQGGEKNPDLKEFVEYCNEQFDVDIVYMYAESDNGDICRLISKWPIYMCLQDDGSVWAYDFYEYYVNGTMQTERTVVAIRDDKNDFEKDIVIAGHKLEAIDRIGNRTIYKFE